MARKKNDNAPTMSQRVNEWRKKTSVAYTIKLNKETQSDVIDKLSQVDNKTSYIVDLIRKDLGTHQEIMTLSDLSKLMGDNEIARLEFIAGRGTPTIWNAGKHDIENDTRVVKEYFKSDDGLLVAKVKAR